MYDDLVKRLKSEADFPYNDNRNLLREAADAIEDLSKPRWIPVEEPPKEDGKYITLFADGSVCDNHYMVFTNDDTHPEDGKWYHNEASMGGVTHWMVFTEQPKEDKL